MTRNLPAEIANEVPNPEAHVAIAFYSLSFRDSARARSLDIHSCT